MLIDLISEIIVFPQGNPYFSWRDNQHTRPSSTKNRQAPSGACRFLLIFLIPSSLKLMGQSSGECVQGVKTPCVFASGIYRYADSWSKIHRQDETGTMFFFLRLASIRFWWYKNPACDSIWSDLKKFDVPWRRWNASQGSARACTIYIKFRWIWKSKAYCRQFSWYLHLPGTDDVEMLWR